MKAFSLLLLTALTGCATVECPPDLGKGETCYYLELPVGGGPASAAVGLIGAFHAMGAEQRSLDAKAPVDP